MNYCGASSRELEADYTLLCEKLEEANLQPSNAQFAAAYAAHFNFKNGDTLQIWTEKPGTGKSRTQLALIYLLTEHADLRNYVLRTTTDLLLNADKSKFEEFAAKLAIKIHFVVGSKEFVQKAY